MKMFLDFMTIFAIGFFGIAFTFLIICMFYCMFDCCIMDTKIGEWCKKQVIKRIEKIKTKKVVLTYKDFVSFYSLNPDVWDLKNKVYNGDEEYCFIFKGLDNIKYLFYKKSLKNRKKIRNQLKYEEKFLESIKKDMKNFKV